MNFVDEVIIHVEAGKGGDGCLSFRREKYIPRGGPDGGDGGDGGSVYLIVDQHINTLVDFRHQQTHKADNGQSGMGKQRTGKSGEDLEISVPMGTTVYDAETGELIGDLVELDQRLCVAPGGFHGLGNARFKSSTNRSPRQTSKGTPGELRSLKLELKLLADVGLLGLPNAGKSTFITAVSKATPKIADYPFTTTRPHLGVVRIDASQSFVIADIPGLIAGASQGAGLGLRFLKHLRRTKLLLHFVDIVPLDDSDPVASVRTIEQELKEYGDDLMDKPRWLVLNKIDLLPPEQREPHCQAILKQLNWTKPVFQISSISGEGAKQLCQQAMQYLQSAD